MFAMKYKLRDHTDSGNETGSKILFLEYLRVYAFISVLVSHKFPEFSHIDEAGLGWILRRLVVAYNFFAPFIWNGGTGVTVFFLVSGYIICKVTYSEPPLIFIIKRIFRIYPAYIFAVLAQFYLVDKSIPGWGDLWPRFCLFGDFMSTPRVLNGVDWTLRVEVLFYVVMSAICVVNKSEKLMPGVFFWVLAPQFPNWTPSTAGFYNKFFPFLLLGAAIFQFETKRIGGGFIFALLTISAINFLLRTDNPQLLDGFFLVAFAIFFLAWIYRNSLPLNFVVQKLANITYSVYLLHNWLFEYARDQMLALGTNKNLAELISVTAIFCTSYVLYELIEKPSIKLGRIIYQSIPPSRREVKI